MQAHVEGTPALAVQVGNAARSAFWAVDLAEAGLPGPRGAIDGPFGYLNLFERTHELAPVLDALGRSWRAAEVSWKPYPTGRAAHGGIDMALELRSQGVNADNVARIRFRAPPLILHLVGRPIVSPLEVNYARLCLPYAMAVALIRGAVTLADFTPAALADAATHALAHRIEIEPGPGKDAAAFTPQSATALLCDGSTREASVSVLPGTRARPLSRERQLEKFHANAALGFGRDVSAEMSELITAIDDLETLADVGALNRLAARMPRS
jgi:2-methylcitrate dehydratase PrpD